VSHFDFNETLLAGLKLIQRKTVVDQRGFFSRFFCTEEFLSLGLNKNIAQINHTLTRQIGAVRGLHFQTPPFAETKIVSCLKGEIFDVAVDLRRGSKTFLQWHGEILSADNARSLFIPEGFAHGFQALTSDCELIYLHSAPYHQPSEGALSINDPRLSIRWPLPIGELSDRDSSHPFIDTGFEGIDL
jgi:dTDP-4-dehydrorhamnose 3,5-epimerase